LAHWWRGWLFGVALFAGACTVPEPGDEQADPGSTSEVDRAPSVEAAAELVRVVDGDSLEVLIEGQEVDVRLATYNAPELYRPQSSAADGANRQCNGERAAAALTELVADGPLTVIGEETDRFGRLIADVRLSGGDLVGTRMVEMGWGLYVGAEDPAGRAAMKQAAVDRRGMWGSACGAPADADLAIGEVQPDPPGSDRDNLNDEWVTVLNRGEGAVDLDGWVIRDDTTSHRFVLSGTLGPGSSLTVRSGSGTSTNTDFHLGETFPVWSNQAETVLLVDPAGVIAAWAFVD
jgi:endonuclease YncB( thermonuclease family)